MNQKYKDKYEELRNNDLGTKQSSDDATTKEDDSYATPGNVRNIGFVWEDGSRVFLNYAYLISSELKIDGEANILTLTFTTNTVKLKGYKLEELYEEVFVQKIRVVSISNRRYSDKKGTECIVTEITLN